MSKQGRYKRVFLTLALALVVTTLVQFGNAGAAKAATYCQCTQYVYQYFGLGGTYHDAYTWDSFLTGAPNYWHRDNIVSVGDIVVFQPGVQIYVQNRASGVWFNYTANSTHGHVGWVSRATRVNTVPTSWNITLTSGNNPSSFPFPAYYSSAGCDNVDDLYWPGVEGSQDGYYVFYHP